MVRHLVMPAGWDIPIAKVTKFLLDVHGRKPERAAFFLGYGFDPGRPDELADALGRHAISQNYASAKVTPHGTVFVFEGPLDTPNGAARDVRSVWQVDRDGGAGRGRFVTAYRYR